MRAPMRQNVGTMNGIGTNPAAEEPMPPAGDGPALADAVVTDPAVVGRTAVVTIRIPGGQAPGEVRLFVRGTYEHLIAYAQEPLEVGRHVVVVVSHGTRAAKVEPTTHGT
jgi:hypothetical protein